MAPAHHPQPRKGEGWARAGSAGTAGFSQLLVASPTRISPRLRQGSRQIAPLHQAMVDGSGPTSTAEPFKPPAKESATLPRLGQPRPEAPELSLPPFHREKLAALPAHPRFPAPQAVGWGARAPEV